MTAGAALDHVFGFTVINDVIAWDELEATWDSWLCQMTLLKNYGTFCPMGLVVVHADELASPDTLAQRTIANGRVHQDGSMKDCWMSMSAVIAWMSSRFTLMSGDVLAMGTPTGIGTMHPADEVVYEIEGIGRLNNSCRRGVVAMSDPRLYRSDPQEREVSLV